MRNVRLEREFQAELELTWATGPDDRTVGADIRRRLRLAERTSRIQCRGGRSVLGGIEQVVDLDTKLGIEPFLDAPDLGDRKIPLFETWAEDLIAAHGSEHALGRRNDHRITRHVAAGFGQRRRPGLSLRTQWFQRGLSLAKCGCIRPREIWDWGDPAKPGEVMGIANKRAA